MNKTERFVYDAVKRNPDLKRLIRNVYQDVFSLIPVKKKISKYEILTREGFFYGFHDHTPFSVNNEMLLANRYLIPLRYPKADDPLEVGYFNGDNFKTWNSIGRTFAWNWHMGCKLQWRGKHRQLIYNDYKNKNFISRLYDVEDNSTVDIGYPIGSISPDGNWAVGYSFERVQRYMPGYGYLQKGTEKDIEKKVTDNSGIYTLNLQTGERKNILSISQIASIKPEPGSENAYHYFSHTVFCPNSKRFIFLHRWVTDNVRNRKTRMFSCDLEGKDLYLFPTKEMVSHIGWRNEEEVIAYARLKDGRDTYVLFQDQKDDYTLVGSHSFNSDGHPSFSPDGRWMITDTYPDKTRRSFLALYDIETEKRYNLAYLHSPSRYRTTKIRGHISCDLHPRWDRRGEFICFDSTFTGKRALCTIKLENLDLYSPKSI